MTDIKLLARTYLSKNKDIKWIGLNQLFLLISNFLLLKLLTNGLDIEEFGYYSLCLTVIIFTRQVIFDPISIVIGKKIGANALSPYEVSIGFTTIRLITDRLFIYSLAIGFISLLFSILIDRLLIGVVVFCCFLYLPSNGAQGIYFNGLNFIKKRMHAALFSILDSILKLFFVFLALQFHQSNIAYVFIGISCGALIVLTRARSYIKHHYSNATDDANMAMRSTLLLSLPLLIPTLLTSFRSVGDRWILASFTGVEELAAFSVLLQIGYAPMLLFIGIIQTYVSPKIYNLSATKHEYNIKQLKNFIEKLFAAILIFTAFAAIATVSSSNLILLAFTGDNYRHFSPYLPLFVIAGAITALSAILHVAVIGVCETRVVGRLMTLAVLLSTGIAVPLIVYFGFVGATLSLLFGGVATAILYWLALHKVMTQTTKR